jgi:hypothetical protein
MNNIQTEIIVYPVPAQNLLTIETSAANTTGNSVSVSTITGQVIKNESFGGNKHVIHIEDLEAGTYIVTVIQGNSVVSRIITKQ